MKVLILAGGFGSRLSEYTESIPKPMVTIGDKPILWHIMNSFAKFDHKDFYVALGYKSKVVKQYFLNYRTLNSNFTVNLSNDETILHQQDLIDWNVSLIETGSKSMTGGRVKRMQKFIGDKTFLLTYGDAVSDINIDELISFHKNHGKMVTVTAVRPAARFGELNIDDNNQVTLFKEKPQITKGWINGGFFVIEPEFFDLIDGDQTILEKSPMEQASKMGQLMSYKHEGFWQCMDTKRDKDLLEDIWVSNSVPWK